MFELDHVSVSYGAAPALWDISLQIQPAELVCDHHDQCHSWFASDTDGCHAFQW